MRKTLALVLLLIIALAASAGGAVAETTFGKTECIISTNEDVVTFNIFDNHAGLGGMTARMIYGPLVRKVDTLEFEFYMAESITYNDEGTEWVVKLREDVDFHDGTHLSAEDLIATLDYFMADLDIHANAKSNLGSITGYHAVDEYTVVLETANPTPVSVLFKGLSQLYVLPSELISEYGDDFFNKQILIGSGPWKFESWEQGQTVTLVRNDNFFDKERLSSLERVVIRVIAEESTRIAAMQTGEVDIVKNLSAINAPQLEGKPGILVDVRASTHATFFQFQMEEGSPFTDKNVRYAWTHCIDRQGICDYILGGGIPLASMLYDGCLGYTELEVPEFNIELAKEYLANSSYNGEEISLMCPTYIPCCDEVMLQVASDLQKAGFKIKVDILQTAEFNERRAAGDYDVFLCNTSLSDPDQPLKLRVLNDAHASHYVNEELNALIVEQGVTIDPEARAEILTQINLIMYEEMAPWTWFNMPVTYRAIREGLTGYVFTGDGIEGFEFITAN